MIAVDGFDVGADAGLSSQAHSQRNESSSDSEVVARVRVVATGFAAALKCAAALIGAGPIDASEIVNAFTDGRPAATEVVADPADERPIVTQGGSAIVRYDADIDRFVVTIANHQHDAEWEARARKRNEIIAARRDSVKAPITASAPPRPAAAF